MEGGSKGQEETAVGDYFPFSLNLTENDGFSIIPSVTLSGAELSDQAMDTTEEHALKSAPIPPDVRPKTTAAQENTVPPGATPSMKEIKAYPIDSMDADLLEAYFESRSKANGGPVAKMELHGDYAIVQFEHEEDARRVLTQPKHTIGKYEIRVEPHVMTDPSCNTAQSEDTRSRTLVVMGTKNMDKEILEVWFESLKYGGGPVEKLNFNEQNGITEVIFETAEPVTYFIKQKTALIRGVTVTFLEPTELDEEEEDEPSSSIILLGVGEELDEEILSMYFANEKRTGGGNIEAIEIDAAKDRAVIRFKDPEVAKRVLEKEELTIMKKRIKISPEIKWKWDGRTIEVHGVSADYDRAILQMILENEKKGGGPVLDLRMDSTCAVATFVNKLDAKRLLEQGEVTIGKHIFKIQQPCAPVDAQTPSTGQKAESEASTEITVVGITKAINEEVLQMFFENEKQSGGGPIEEIKVDEECGTALITYQTSAIAERVAGRRKLALMGQELTVDLRANMKKSFHQASHSRQESRVKEQNLLLEVTNLPEGTGDQMLELIFQSSKHGGGPVKEVILNAETRTATIRFEKQETVESVMTKYRAKKSAFTINAVQLMLNVVDESNTVQVKNSCAIQVKDIPVNNTDKDIAYYFENRRVCGGPVEEVYNLKDSCVITFMEPEVASRVYQRHCLAPLKMENITLKVKLMTNSHRLKTFGDEAIIQPNTLNVEDLPDNTTRDSLISYLEKVPDSKISDIWFGIHVGVAIVMFSKMPKWLRFVTHCCLKPFHGHMLGISCVERTKSIEVYNIGNCTKQNLAMYFEHNRSGGGEIERTDVDPNKDYAIVTFKKYGAADAVVAKKKHSLKNNELLVRLHYPCLSILPVDHDKSTPKSSIPNDIVCHPVDKDIMLLLSQRRSKDFIDEQLATVHTKIDWADSASSVLESVTLKCTLPVAKASKDQTEEWPNKAKDAFWATYKLYSKETVNVLQDGWTEFSTQILPLVPSTDTLKVFTNAEACSVVIVGKSTDVSYMLREILQVKYAVENANYRRKKYFIPPKGKEYMESAEIKPEVFTSFLARVNEDALKYVENVATKLKKAISDGINIVKSDTWFYMEGTLKAVTALQNSISETKNIYIFIDGNEDTRFEKLLSGREVWGHRDSNVRATVNIPYDILTAYYIFNKGGHHIRKELTKSRARLMVTDITDATVTLKIEFNSVECNIKGILSEHMPPMNMATVGNFFTSNFPNTLPALPCVVIFKCADRKWCIKALVANNEQDKWREQLRKAVEDPFEISQVLHELTKIRGCTGSVSDPNVEEKLCPSESFTDKIYDKSSSSKSFDPSTSRDSRTNIKLENCDYIGLKDPNVFYPRAVTPKPHEKK